MADALSHQIQEACDDLYCSPLDPVAQANARDLLRRSTPAMDERTLARRIRIACDELHDDPDDFDARHTLLALLDPTSPASNRSIVTVLP
ncbi:hypothetical protein [Mycolicibacterium palauense]|uniref:hypothetical protein n=1 Tax=Mycolicibacterium palauense TaxID=2034511 RepID=UPI000BFEE158|nr:hypothetical protein [Mycolicibacterium palauense]